MKHFSIIIAIVVCFLFAYSSTAQTAASDNKLSQSYTYRHPIPKGPAVYGIFEGRPPCREIAKQVDSPATAECTKIKWRLILYQDSVTKQPSAYQLLGRYLPAEGKWQVIHGTKSNPAAEVYQLTLARPNTYFYFLKGDENVLFILDENKELRTGNQYFSYTLNRVELIPDTVQKQ